jgi:116 kDa U5 small nuclear ribonucleoprotein component
MVYSKEIPRTFYSDEYMVQIMSKPQLLRNVAIVGALHHGKSIVSDMLIQSTFLEPVKITNATKDPRYTDSRLDEIDRGISVKSSPFQVLLQDDREKSYAYNFIDTPGHPNFSDEVAAGLRLTDNVCFVVDVLEGLTLHGTKLLESSLKHNKPIILVINKLDRLVLEVKLPPADGYHKIKMTLDEVNLAIQKYKAKDPRCTQPYLSPLHKNVLFASGQFHVCFSLETFAQMYRER